MEPRVGIAHIEVTAADGTFTIGREAFPDFERYARLGVHVQSDQVRIALPPPGYVETGLTALAEACRELGIPHADIAFVDTVVAPPRFGLRYGFKGAYTTDRPDVVWIFANWTTGTSFARWYATKQRISRSRGRTRPRSPRATADPPSSSRSRSRTLDRPGGTARRTSTA